MKIEQRVLKLAKNMCANYFEPVGCYMLEFKEIKCVYEIKKSLEFKRCNYFEEAVLPLDSVLEAEYQKEVKAGPQKQVINCHMCGKEITKNSPRQKYCQSCGHNQSLRSKRDYKNNKAKTMLK